MTTPFFKKDHPIEWIPVNKTIVVWPETQRACRQSRVDNIARYFDPDLFGVATVTLPNGNGMYHVIDGQTRIAAVRQLYGDDQRVPCMVLPEVDKKRAAALFRRLNASQHRASPVELFITGVTEGAADEVAVNGILNAFGLTVSNTTADGTFRAVARALAIYRKGGGELLHDTLNAIDRTWGLTAEAVNGSVLEGFAVFMQTHGASVDVARLARKIATSHTPSTIIGAARNLRDMLRGSVGTNVARIILENYNHGLRGDKLESA